MKIQLTEKQFIDINKPIEPTEINVFLAVTSNQVDKLSIVLYSLLKYSKSKFNVYIMLDMQNVQHFTYLNNFNNEQMKVTLLNNKLLNQLDPTYEISYITKMTYAKLLAPFLFPKLDKILYLDYDAIVIKQGIEWFWNMSFENKYLLAQGGDCFYAKEYNQVPKGESEWVIKEHYIFSQLTNFYFNAGVLLWNLKKIRQDGKDKEILHLIKHKQTDKNNKQLRKIERRKLFKPQEDIRFFLHDQSILNYIFRKGVLNLNTIFNSCFINMLTQKQLEEPFRKVKLAIDYFDNEQDYEDNIVIAHFVGPQKPWNFKGKYKSTYQKKMYQKWKTLFIEYFQKNNK